MLCPFFSFLSTTFCFCQLKSVEVHWYVVLNLFAQFLWKFPATFMYQFVNIDDIMLFPAERRRNFPLISYICLQHVDGNFQRHFFKIFLKIPMIFAFVFKTSVKLFIDSLSLFAKCRWKFLSHLSIYWGSRWYFAFV